MAAKGAAAPQPRVALLAGASGLTGGALLRQLLRDAGYVRVLALSRRPLPLEHARLGNRILKFDELERSLKGTRCTDAFCTLGAAGGPRADEATLRAVDLQLVLQFARAALEAGATRIVVVSAAGADRHSGNGFLRVKGEMESSLRHLKFQGIDIVQPGVLFGTRREDGALDLLRDGLLALAAPLLRSSTRLPAPFSGEQVASAMLAAARSRRSGAHSYSGARLAQLGLPARPGR